MASYIEFSKKIKEKYPAYADRDDLELAKRFVEKYPAYADRVEFGTQQPVQSKTLAERTAGLMALPKSPSTIQEGLKVISPFPSRLPKTVQEGVKSIPRLGTAPLMMESIGSKIGDIGQKASGGIAEKSGRIGLPPLFGATVGTAAGTVTELAKPTFSNVMVTAMGELSPSVIGHLTKKLPVSITNRFLKTPQSIAKARLDRGEGTTGKVFLNKKELNPEGIGRLPTSDKAKIYDIAKSQIAELGKKANTIIDDLFKKGITPEVKPVSIKGTPQLPYFPSGYQQAGAIPKPRITSGRVGMEYVEPKVGTIGSFEETGLQTAGGRIGGRFAKGGARGAIGESDIAAMAKVGEGNFPEVVRGLKEPTRTPFTGMKKEPAIYKSDLGIRPKVFDNVVDTIMKGADEWDIAGSDLKILNRVKNNEALDFKTANRFREILGDYVGKRFEREELPEKMDAVIGVFGRLRQRIGKISPELDSILKQQHEYFDILNSVRAVKAKGYQDTVFNINPFELFGIPKAIGQSPKAASILQSIPKTRGVGLLPLGRNINRNE